MKNRCYQCGKCEPGFDDTENGTEGDLCNCEDLCSALEQKNNMFEMQLGRIKSFKSQDTETGNFDITFELSGKLLYAHKIMVTTVSTTMAAWISDRWSTKDDIIKIETYTYEEFFQFLTFLYSGTCKISKDNAFQLIDMAEFFDVTVMKNQCDIYLSKMIQEIDVANVDEMMEIAHRYSLAKSVGALKDFIRRNIQKIIETDEFVKFKRPLLDALLSIQKHAYYEQQLFLSVVKWVEHQVSTKEPTLEGTDFLDAVKVVFEEMKSRFNFSNMHPYFVVECVVSKDYLFSTVECYKMLDENDNRVFCNEEDLKTIFEIAEKKALKEQNTLNDETFNLQDVIKRELSEILPKVNFQNSEFEFVKQLVVDKKFLFSSKELFKNIAQCQRTGEEEIELFEMLYEMAKKNVETRNLPEEMTDLPNAIKAELAECLPKIKFYKMDKNYLIDFAAKTGFISREEAIRCFYARVQVYSGGKLLIGTFEDLLKILNYDNRYVHQDDDDSGWIFDVTPRSNNKLRFTGLQFDVPKSRSPIQQMRGAEWYLLLEKDGILTAKHQSLIKRGDYLIGEMRSTEEFSFALKQKTLLFVSHNTIFLNCLVC